MPASLVRLGPTLNTKLFDEDVEQVAIRTGFGEGLVCAGESDPRVVVLCGDLTESAQALPFKKKFPDRFVELGVAEQNMASVASGMAAMGKIPFITSYAMFSPGRNWEQIRTTIAYNNRPVKIAGSHAGVSVGPDGASLPNIVISEAGYLSIPHKNKYGHDYPPDAGDPAYPGSKP